ncbi:DUF2946 domain-containing protein [Pseudomonas sp. BN515]|uniref:DUF2946 domain-containing protein n=1 Tax=Pseudomonas sp. BN515 TaxID=2567892 RepID=UPI0024548964|nr:DUF2946 domain-containing protein [Pseudomonas sp. BN515]MDH4871240.1 DUF2946 domain-containing protein [Pseudomonas sp. BN515]
MPMAAPRIRHRHAHSTALPVRMRVGLWLGLFAMLAIYFGALASQVRVAQAELPGWLTELACDHGEQPSPMPSHHGSASPLDACGYCNLLAASPALGNTLPAAALAVPVEGAPRRPRFIGPPAQAPLFPGARPRAPPRSS